MKTALVIFTKNEEKIISQVMDQLNGQLKQISKIHPALFVCDDSTDKTAEIAKSKGAKIIKGSGKGLGWSYYLALHLLSKKDFDAIISIDGDGQTDLSEVPLFYRELEKGYDLLVGSRFLQKDSISYSYSKVNFIGTRILSFAITFATFQKFTDSHGGLRAMRAKAVQNIQFLGGHSYVQESIISTVEKGLKVRELPSRWERRIHGESRVLHSKWRYIKGMSLPLILRMRVHWWGGILSALLALSHPKYVLYCITALCIFMEIYRQMLFQKNKKQIQKWADQRGQQ